MTMTTELPPALSDCLSCGMPLDRPTPLECSVPEDHAAPQGDRLTDAALVELAALAEGALPDSRTLWPTVAVLVAEVQRLRIAEAAVEALARHYQRSGNWRYHGVPIALRAALAAARTGEASDG